MICYNEDKYDKNTFCFHAGTLCQFLAFQAPSPLSRAMPHYLQNVFGLPVRLCFQWQEGAGPARNQVQWVCAGNRGAGFSQEPGAEGGATRGCPLLDDRTGNLLNISCSYWISS